MRLKKIIKFFMTIMSIMVFSTFYNTKSMDSKNINIEELNGDVISAILKHVVDLNSIFKVTQEKINYIKVITLLKNSQKNWSQKSQLVKKASEILNTLKSSAYDFLDQFLDKPKNLIKEAMELDTEFSKSYIKRLINTNFETYNPEVAEKIKELFIGAVKDGQLETVKFLIKAGTDPNFSDNYGDSVLILAASKGKKEMIEALLNSGADPNIKDGDGETALMRAIDNDEIGIIELLLNNNKTNINAQNCNRDTAVTLAASQNKKSIIGLLLNAGADPNIKNNDEKTASQLAFENGHKSIVKIIKKFKKNKINKKK